MVGSVPMIGFILNHPETTNLNRYKRFNVPSDQTIRANKRHWQLSHAPAIPPSGWRLLRKRPLCEKRPVS